MRVMGAPMAGRLTQGKVAPVLESYGALKSEKFIFLVVIFFYLTLFQCAGFCGAPSDFFQAHQVVSVLAWVFMMHWG